MKERPQDIATLYSRAYMQGSRYWDFSASRKQVQGRFRQPNEPEPALPGPALQHRVTRLAPLPEPVEAAREPALPQATEGAREGTREGTREGLATRWYALHSVFNPHQAIVDPPVAPPHGLEQGPPMLVVFSLAGGVGKTCLVATLGCALSAFAEHVLLTETAACGLLPFYFGSAECKPGVVRTFSPPKTECDAPVQVLNLQTDCYPGEGSEPDPLLGELSLHGRGASRILVDVATAGRQMVRRLLLLQPTVLVPVLPDMSSVVSLGLLEEQGGGSEKTFYLLNQFDDSSPLHGYVRAMLQQRLGDRLLPFVVRRSSEVSEALAEGMTVMDYAPGSGAAEDYRNLALWLRSFAPPAVVAHGGMRWSER